MFFVSVWRVNSLSDLVSRGFSTHCVNVVGKRVFNVFSLFLSSILSVEPKPRGICA